MVGQDDDSSAVVAVRLDNGARTTLLGANQMNYSIHISCRNVKRPAWTYVSEFAGDESMNANYQEVLAVRIDGSRRVQRFAHLHHSSSHAYARQPHAVPNRNGSKVLWASDWNDGSAPVYTYVARMPGSR